MPLIFALISSVIFAITAVSSPEADAATKRQSVTKYEFTMPKAYQPQGSNGGYDDYRCFLIDPKVNVNSILTTIEFIPKSKRLFIMQFSSGFQLNKWHKLKL